MISDFSNAANVFAVKQPLSAGYMFVAAPVYSYCSSALAGCHMPHATASPSAAEELFAPWRGASKNL